MTHKVQVDHVTAHEQLIRDVILQLGLDVWKYHTLYIERECAHRTGMSGGVHDLGRGRWWWRCQKRRYDSFFLRPGGRGYRLSLLCICS